MKILCIDIETSPNLGYVWSLWQQNVGLSQLVATTEMICFAAKWLGEDETFFFSAHQHGRRTMVEAAWRLLNAADVVMHYNGKKFDVPHLNREFLEHGMLPPSPYKQVDLLSAVKKRFRLPSNKLQYVSTLLGLEGKVSHEGFDLWVKCMSGDAGAWAKMEVYNRQDVQLLEDVFEILLPWLPGFPSRHLFDGEGACPACGSGPVVEDGLYRTKVSVFPQYKCSACGSWFRATRRIGGVTIQEAAA